MSCCVRAVGAPTLDNGPLGSKVTRALFLTEAAVMISAPWLHHSTGETPGGQMEAVRLPAEKCHISPAGGRHKVKLHRGAPPTLKALPTDRPRSGCPPRSAPPFGQKGFALVHKVREAWEGRNCELLLHQQCAGLVKVDAACFLVRPPTHNHRCFEVLAGLPVKGGTGTAKALGKKGAFFQA